MQNALRFLLKKKVLPLWQITFDPLKKGLKNIHQCNGAKLVFFNRNLRAFCIYFLQVLKSEFEVIYIICRYCPPISFCPQIWKTKKSSKIEGNTLRILRRSFFPFNALGMPSFNNSVSLIILSKNVNKNSTWQYCCKGKRYFKAKSRLISAHN